VRHVVGLMVGQREGLSDFLCLFIVLGLEIWWSRGLPIYRTNPLHPVSYHPVFLDIIGRSLYQSVSCCFILSHHCPTQTQAAWWDLWRDSRLRGGRHVADSEGC
jgi:hypothetical protein